MYGSENQRSKQQGDTSLYSFKNTTKEGGLSDEFDQEIRKYAREIINQHLRSRWGVLEACELIEGVEDFFDLPSTF